MLANRTVLLVAALIFASACHRNPGPSGGLETTARSDTVVGWIHQIRGSVMLVREDPGTEGRGEIWVSPNTEITTRSGMLLPVSALRAGMRVKVWLRDGGSTRGRALATADRMYVDY